MAAVFGVIGAVTAYELDEMGRRLAHRGAHAQWREVAEDVYLGHVATAPQRDIYQDHRFSIVIDAAEALAPGYGDRVVETFLRTRCAADVDRELTLPFTLAAWDELTQRLVLARDFLGLKPLHFSQLPSGGIAFATEYKALLALKEIPATPDRSAIEYLQFYKAMPPGKTLLAGIRPVPPGSVLHIQSNGEVEREDRMPDVRLAVEPMTETQACAQLRDRLLRAIAPLVQGRSRVGIALSGGIDSMSVAFLARRSAPSTELIGFTAGEHPDDPEIARAAQVMAHVGGRHEQLVVDSAELLTKLPLAVWHLENPIGRSETFQYLALAKLAKQHGLDYLLTGMGSDLLFGGMPRHIVLWMSEVAPFLRKDLLAFFEATQTGQPASRPLARLMTTLYYRGGLPPAPRVLNSERASVPELVAAPGREFINRCLMLDGQEPTSRTLARIERPFQAYGLEYGSPYLDKDVIQFAFTMPSRLKIRRGVQKYILRQAMRPWMPDSLRKAPKELMRMQQGGSFVRTLQQLADHYLSSERIRRRGFFDPAEIERIRRACHWSRHPETAMRLWTAIVTEAWAEIYIDGRGKHPLAAALTGADRSAFSAAPAPATS